jgi:hypothetical protein
MPTDAPQKPFLIRSGVEVDSLFQKAFQMWVAYCSFDESGILLRKNLDDRCLSDPGWTAQAQNFHRVGFLDVDNVKPPLFGKGHGLSLAAIVHLVPNPLNKAYQQTK